MLDLQLKPIEIYARVRGRGLEPGRRFPDRLRKIPKQITNNRFFIILNQYVTM